MTKRNKNRIPVHFGIKVIDNSYTIVTKERDPNEEWDGENTYTSHNITGIELTEHGYDTDVVLEYLPTVGKEYYLLYGNYSTGDSFNHHTGQIFYIDLFEDYEFARQIKILFEKPENSGKNDISLLVKVEILFSSMYHGLVILKD